MCALVDAAQPNPHPTRRTQQPPTHTYKTNQNQEITIHHTLRRQFWWYEGQLFLDEIRCPAFIGLSGNDEIVPSDTLKVYVDDFLERHHAEEHARYAHRSMLAHQQEQQQEQHQQQQQEEKEERQGGGGGGGEGGNGHPHHSSSSSSFAAPAVAAAPSASAASASGSSAAPQPTAGARGGKNATVSYVFDDAEGGARYANHAPTCRCELGHGGKGCLRQRIQYAYWPRWSHGEILFRLPTLYALDAQLRDQERFFRTREVEDAMTASMRPLPRSKRSSLLLVDARGGGGGGGGGGSAHRPVSMPAAGGRRAMVAPAGVAADGAGNGVVW
jgi:hypothetical protein